MVQDKLPQKSKIISRSVKQTGHARALHNQKTVKRTEFGHIETVNKAYIPPPVKEKKPIVSVYKNTLLLLNIAFLIFIAQLYFFNSNQSVKTVLVGNSKHYSKNELDLKAGVGTQAFNAVDGFVLSTELSKLPWVKLIKAKKFPPSYLAYIIEERTPSAKLWINKKPFLIDSDQVLLPLDADEPVGLVKLLLEGQQYDNLAPGIRLNSLNIDAANLWIEKLKTSEVLKINEVNEIDISNPFRFEISAAAQKYYVKYNEIEQQLQRLDQYKSIIGNNKLKQKYLDLRIPNRVIIGQ